MFCCQLLECLEFSKARLFLRQVEVHFHKQPSEIQKIIATMVQWGETQRNYQEVWRTDSTLMTCTMWMKKLQAIALFNNSEKLVQIFLECSQAIVEGYKFVLAKFRWKIPFQSIKNAIPKYIVCKNLDVTVAHCSRSSSPAVANHSSRIFPIGIFEDV